MITPASAARIDRAFEAGAAMRRASEALTSAHDDAPGPMTGLFGKRDAHYKERLQRALEQTEEGVRLLGNTAIGSQIENLRFGSFAANYIRSGLNHRNGPREGLRAILDVGPYQTNYTAPEYLSVAERTTYLLPLIDPPDGARMADMSVTLRRIAARILDRPDRELTVQDLEVLDDLAQLDQKLRLSSGMPSGAQQPRFPLSTLIDPAPARIRMMDDWNYNLHREPFTGKREPWKSPSVMEHVNELREWVARTDALETAVDEGTPIPPGISQFEQYLLLDRLKSISPEKAASAAERLGIDLGDVSLVPEVAHVNLVERYMRDLDALETVHTDDAALVAETRRMLADNSARYGGTLIDGLAYAPRYDDFGTIAANIEFLKMRSEAREYAASLERTQW